jgi:hypothetical protein
MADAPLTTTALTAATVDALTGAGYDEVDQGRIGKWPAPGARVFEDPYSVAALIVYETWAELAGRWLEAQAALADLLSAHFNSEDAKSWEGYLVLITPSVLPRESRLEAGAIRRDVTHARKLLITGDELVSLEDVERGLLPLLPLRTHEIEGGDQTALDLLPDLLSQRHIPTGAVDALLTAFADQQPLAERLDRFLREEQTA